jgi:hypothetical protein
MSEASLSGLRILSAKLRETVVAASAGPRWAAWRIAAARVGGGEAVAKDAFAGVVWLEGEEEGAHALKTSTNTTARAFIER